MPTPRVATGACGGKRHGLSYPAPFEGKEKMKLSAKKMLCAKKCAAVTLVAGCCLVAGAGAQEKPETRQTTKQAVEARLKAAEKPKATAPLDEAVNAIFSAHHFEQTAISPDGKKVAWV